MSTQRILLLGLDTAGFCTSLGDSLSRLGSEIKYLARDDFPDYRTTLLKKPKLCRPPSNFAFFADTTVGHWRHTALRLASHSWRIAFAIRVLYELTFRLRLYDGIIQSGPNVGVPPRLSELLTRFRRGQLIVVFHGSDVRPAYINGALGSGKGSSEMRRLARTARRQAKLAHRTERIADRIVVWRAISHFFTRPVLLHEAIGFPCNVPSEQSQKSSANNTLSVLHATSNVRAKGSLQIRDICVALADDGLPILYREISKGTHSETLDSIRRADIIVDQLYTDNVASVLSIEAGRLGKTVISSSWSIDPDLFSRENLVLPPIYLSHSNDFKKSLTEIIRDRGLREDVGQRLATFHSQHWSPDSVAQFYLSMICDSKGKVFDEMDPRSSSKPFGGYAPEDELKAQVSRYVDYHGVQSLYLSHNPDLERSLVAWAKSG